MVAAVLALIVTPIANDELGVELYGVWQAIVALTGYYGLLDLGIRAAVTQYIARHWSRGENEELGRLLSTALAITGAIATILLLGTIGLSFVADWFFDGAARESAPHAILVFGVGVAISFPMSVFGAAIQARERFDLANIIGITERVLCSALYVWALLTGKGIIALAWITTGTSVAAHIARGLIARRLLPGVPIAANLVCREKRKDLFGFGLYSFLVSMSDRLVLYTDTLIILILMSEAAVTYYSNGGSFIHHYLGLIAAIAWTLTPRATSFDALQNKAALRQMWYTGSRLIVQFATIVGAGLFFLGHDFIGVWLDPKFLLGEPYASSAVIMQLLALAALTRCLMTCGKQVLYGMREVRFLARLSVAEAVANIALSVPGVIFFGNIGVALGTLIPAVVVNLWLQPRFVAKKLGASYGLFLGNVVPPALMVFGAMGAASYASRALVPVTGWGTFAANVAFVGTVGVGVAWAFGLGPAERERVLRKLPWRTGSVERS